MAEFLHDGIRFHYRDEGSGIPFVFQHGLGADLSQPFSLCHPPPEGVRRARIKRFVPNDPILSSKPKTKQSKLRLAVCRITNVGTRKWNFGQDFSTNGTC